MGVPRARGATGTRRPCTGGPPNAKDRPPVLLAAFGASQRASRQAHPAVPATRRRPLGWPARPAPGTLQALGKAGAG